MVTDVVGIVVAVILVLALLGQITFDFIQNRAMTEGRIRRHKAKRQLELERHRFEVARDGNQVRRQLREELRGGRS